MHSVPCLKILITEAWCDKNQKVNQTPLACVGPLHRATHMAVITCKSGLPCPVMLSLSLIYSAVVWS